MNRPDLIELRELFRKRFREEDFCIGEAQVEKLFRELLNEPEPEEPHGPPIRSKELYEALEVMMSNNKVNDLFNRDNTFYYRVTKK